MSREELTYEVSELVMRGFRHGQEGYSAVTALVDLIEREKSQARAEGAVEALKRVNIRLAGKYSARDAQEAYQEVIDRLYDEYGKASNE